MQQLLENQHFDREGHHAGHPQMILRPTLQGQKKPRARDSAPDTTQSGFFPNSDKPRFSRVSKRRSRNWDNSLSSRDDPTAADHIVRRQRPPDPLQLELTDWLDLHGVLDLRQHSRADEDLPRLGFIAEPRGDVGHRPDGGIVEASLEADRAERSEAVRNADAEANLVPEATPGFASKLRLRHALQAP